MPAADHRLLLRPAVAVDLPRPRALRPVAKAAGATVNVLPVDLGGKVFPVSGGLPLAKRAPQRQAYRLVELKRFSEYLGRPINLQAEVLSGRRRRRRAADHRGRHARRHRRRDAARRRGAARGVGRGAQHRRRGDAGRDAGRDRPAGAPPRRRAVAGGARALRGRHAARHRRRRVRRAQLRDRRRDVLGPGPARLRRAPAGPRAAMRRGGRSRKSLRRPALRRPPALHVEACDPNGACRLFWMSTRACSARACARSSPTAGPTTAASGWRRRAMRPARPAWWSCRLCACIATARLHRLVRRPVDHADGRAGTRRRPAAGPYRGLGEFISTTARMPMRRWPAP